MVLAVLLLASSHDDDVSIGKHSLNVYPLRQMTVLRKSANQGSACYFRTDFGNHEEVVILGEIVFKCESEKLPARFNSEIP